MMNASFIFNASALWPTSFVGEPSTSSKQKPRKHSRGESADESKEARRKLEHLFETMGPSDMLIKISNMRNFFLETQHDIH